MNRLLFRSNAIFGRLFPVMFIMAVGARPRDIVWQFLSEALVLGLAGGVLGVLTGVGVSFYLEYFTASEVLISIPSILFSFLFTFVIGLVFGVYPARRAALLDPIEALRQ